MVFYHSAGLPESSRDLSSRSGIFQIPFAGQRVWDYSRACGMPRQSTRGGSACAGGEQKNGWIGTFELSLFSRPRGSSDRPGKAAAGFGPAPSISRRCVRQATLSTKERGVARGKPGNRVPVAFFRRHGLCRRSSVPVFSAPPAARSRWLDWGDCAKFIDGA